MINAKPWDFLQENPVEKTIVVDREALLAPLADPFGLYEYTGEIDLFEDKVETDAICQAFAVMTIAANARFMVATLQPTGAREILRFLRPHLDTIAGHCAAFFEEAYNRKATIDFDPNLEFIPNLALGVPVSDQSSADDRVAALLSVPAAFHFAAYAPAAGPIDWRGLRPELGAHIALDYRLDALAGQINFRDGRRALDARGSLDWIFASGEGRGYRNMVHPDWIRQSALQALGADVAFAFEAWGSVVPGPEISIDEVARNRLAGSLRKVAFEGGERIVAIAASEWDPDLVMVGADLAEPVFPPLVDGVAFYKIPPFLDVEKGEG